MDLAYAFGVKETLDRTCVLKYLEKNGSNKRKQRPDAGETLFNSNNKHEQVWMTKNYFAKVQPKNNEGDVLPSDEIN